MLRVLFLLTLPVVAVGVFDPSQYLTGNFAGSNMFNNLPARCMEPSEPGRARGSRPSSPRFFFNSTSGNCEVFQYMGRGGNRNNFRNVFQCMKSCGCRQQKNEGVPCHPPKRPMTGYYYDSFTRICNAFQHTGCGGNSNHFNNMMDCVFTCGENIEW